MSLNSVEKNISIDMVQNFNVSAMCLESLPCQHKCEIILSDGRKKSVTLLNPTINAFIQKIPLERISFPTSPYYLSHFSSWSPFDPSEITKENLEETLTDIFNTAVAQYKDTSGLEGN